MLPAVVADLEQGVGHQLLRPLLVGEQPLSAGEEGRLDTAIAQKVDDVSLVPRNLVGLLAQIERERDELQAGGQLDAAYGEALPRRYGLRAHGSAPRRLDQRRSVATLDAILALLGAEPFERPAHFHALAESLGV